jgi:transcriptional regulator with XRE-family HTH domain
MNDKELLHLLGTNVKKIRTERGLSQYGLALETGMAHNSINDIENGKRWVSAKSLSKIAAALDVEPYVFFLPESVEVPENTAKFIKLYHEDLYGAITSAIETVKQRYSIN